MKWVLDNNFYMPEDRPSLDISELQIDKLIKEKTRDKPSKQAELKTRAKILSPLVRSPNKLGLSSEQQTAVRIYARAAGEAAKQQAIILAKENKSLSENDEFVRELNKTCGQLGDGVQIKDILIRSEPGGRHGDGIKAANAAATPPDGWREYLASWLLSRNQH